MAAGGELSGRGGAGPSGRSDRRASGFARAAARGLRGLGGGDAGGVAWAGDEMVVDEAGGLHDKFAPLDAHR